jgi:hypothetical protein
MLVAQFFWVIPLLFVIFCLFVLAWSPLTLLDKCFEHLVMLAFRFSSMAFLQDASLNIRPALALLDSSSATPGQLLFAYLSVHFYLSVLV